MPLAVNIENPVGRPAAEQAVFGQALTDVDYADMAGDILGDAQIRVRYNEPWLHGGGPDARIRIRARTGLQLPKFASFRAGSTSRSVGCSLRGMVSER